MPRTFTLASRTSELARTQTNNVVATLQQHFPKNDTNPDFKTSFMSTSGDMNTSTALYLIGGKSFWTKELEMTLKEGAVDMLVHCYKDVPTKLPEGRFEGIELIDARGNLNTRLAKLDDPDGKYDALILAKAGLVRLGWGNRITQSIPPSTLLYAVSQGALAIEVRADDKEALEYCKVLTHRPTLWKCNAERACLRVLEGGCSVPVGVSTELITTEDEGDEVLEITGCVTSIDGKEHVEHTIKEVVRSLEDAERVGETLAGILIERGGKKILDEINVDRERRINEAVVM